LTLVQDSHRKPLFIEKEGQKHSYIGVQLWGHPRVETKVQKLEGSKGFGELGRGGGGGGVGGGAEGNPL